MAAPTTSVNTGQLVQFLLEYGQRVRDIQERAWVYSNSSYTRKGLPLLYAAINSPHQLLSTTGGDAKAQKEFQRNLAEKANAYVAELQPLVTSLRIISQNFGSIAKLLEELHRVLGSLTLRSYPDLLHQFMDTFCGAVKAGLLLEDVPRKAAAQMVQLACVHVDKEVAAQLRGAVSDHIFSEPSMVCYMQKIFRATMPRIAQVLELVVGPAMTVADNCEGVSAAGLLEMTQQQHHQPGEAGGEGATGAEAEASPAMGMFGMTRQQVYPFLRHREAIRQWGILGFLIFPEILGHPNSSQRLSQLLSDGFAIHIYKERMLSAHQLLLQHLGPTAYSALGSNSGASNGALSPRSGGGLGGLLGKMAMIGGVGRLRKSLSDEQEANENKPPHPIFVDAAGAAAVVAPLQHRMWRAYLTGQLRAIHAACAANPSRITGQMDMLLAALSMGREELLWFCRRTAFDVPQELVPALTARGTVGGGKLCGPTIDDELQALQLLSAMDAIHRLLVENHATLCKQIKDAVGADLQAHVATNTGKVEFRLRQAAALAAGNSPASAAAAATGASGLQPFKDLTDLLRSVLLSTIPPADAAARVSSACGIWIYVSLQLASADPPLKAARVLQYAEDTRYLDVLQKSLDAARLLYEGPLLHASAADLAPGLQYRMEPLRAAAKSALCSGRMEHMQAALGAMQGLHWLLPSRAEAYAAAVTASTNNAAPGGLLSRTSVGSAATGTGNSTQPGVRGNAARQQGPADDLPGSCMKDVLECLRLLLSPIVLAPLRNAAALNNASRSSNPTHTRTGPSLMRVMSRPKDKDRDSNGGGAGRSATPERVRAQTADGKDSSGANGPAAFADGPLSKNLQNLALADSREPAYEELENQHVPQRDAAGHAELTPLPPASELASRLLPIVLALDNGRMLLADSRSSDALPMCRSQLVDAIRDNFSQLIVNTAAAISQVAIPVPSVQLGPLRLFVEVISLLQPHLATELLPELARLLLQQTAAPTLQTIGLEAVSGPMRQPNTPAPPSTSAEAAAPTTPHGDAAGHNLPQRAGSTGSAGAPPSNGAMGPMTRSLNASQQATNSARTSAGEPERIVGPMTKAFSNAGSSGGAPVASAASSGTAATVSIVRALHDWLWRTVIFQQDERHPVVWYDAEIGAFVSGESAPHGSVAKGSAGLAAATCVRELALIFEFFGPCAASDLTRGCDQLIHACLEEMQAFLDANQVPLQELLDASRMPLDKRFAAVGRALPTLASPATSATASRGPQCLKGLTDTVQRLGRCLALRVQLGRAAAAAADRVADFVTLALREMATPVSVSSGGAKPSAAVDGGAAAVERREWAALLRLSSGSSAMGETDCSFGACLLPEKDDILITAHLASLLPGLAAAQRWHRLPALMAALMVAPQWNAGLAPSGAHVSRSGKGSSTPRASSTLATTAGQQAISNTTFAPLAAINTVTVALSLSLQSAMSQVLHPAASQFLMGCDNPVAAMLCAYQRTALAVSQAAAVGTGAECSPAATAAKQHMLASLEQIPLLRRYTYVAAYTPEEAIAVDAPASNEVEGAPPSEVAASGTVPALNGSLELSQSWWASSGTGVSLSLSGPSQPMHKAPGSLVHIEVCEPSLADGRWSGEVDAWRPPSRLLPLVMGHLG